MTMLSDHMRTLGRSGLIVSPLALGAMTFGRDGWGSDESGSAAMFDAYVAAGGNFIDTAETYSGGNSEQYVGRFIKQRGLRDRMVLATKFGWSNRTDGPGSGGNGNRNIRRAVEGSLRRLDTDWIDLYWLHVWDMVTPAEEVLTALNGLITEGKIRHFGLSNVPAWYLSKMATLAQAHNLMPPIAIQMEYSLVERSIEREHIPAAREFGIGVQPWSPLAGGFLSGKYDRAAYRDASGRLNGANPFGDSKFIERNWTILDALRTVAADIGCSMSQVALSWLLGRPGVTSTLIGGKTPEQIHDNIGALGIILTDAQRGTLDAATIPDEVYPYQIFEPRINRLVFDADIAGWHQQQR
jgi:aryl-alcohol dehydrogenase-like predicted oxidoreductase